MFISIQNASEPCKAQAEVHPEPACKRQLVSTREEERKERDVQQVMTKMAMAMTIQSQNTRWRGQVLCKAWRFRT